jgi:hypothetical protein
MEEGILANCDALLYLKLLPTMQFTTCTREARVRVCFLLQINCLVGSRLCYLMTLHFITQTYACRYESSLH